MGQKTPKTAGSDASPPAADQKVEEAEWSETQDGEEPETPRRRDLLEEAIRSVRTALRKEETPSRTSIANLVQLLRLHKELIQEEETPTHIQLVWNEVDEGMYGDD
jgi:hypothetical protein